MRQGFSVYSSVIVKEQVDLNSVYAFTVYGLSVKASYDDGDVEQILRPLIRCWQNL